MNLIRLTMNKLHGINILQADLRSVLYETTKNGVEFRFNQKITSVTQKENSAAILFSIGKEEIFDIVIGVDSMHSKTRELVFGKGFEKY